MYVCARLFSVKIISKPVRSITSYSEENLFYYHFF